MWALVSNAKVKWSLTKIFRWDLHFITPKRFYVVTLFCNFDIFICDNIRIEPFTIEPDFLSSSANGKKKQASIVFHHQWICWWLWTTTCLIKPEKKLQNVSFGYNIWSPWKENSNQFALNVSTKNTIKMMKLTTVQQWSMVKAR